MQAGTINNLTVENGSAGKKVFSFQILSSVGNHSAEAAQALAVAAREELASLPERLDYDPSTWTGIGEQCPVRMRVVGEGAEAKLQFMFNSPYTDPSFTQRSALLKLPEILQASGVLAAGQDAVLREQIEAKLPQEEVGGGAGKVVRRL